MVRQFRFPRPRKTSSSVDFNHRNDFLEGWEVLENLEELGTIITGKTLEARNGQNLFTAGYAHL